MTAGVYEILNTAGGKRYIGSAVSFSQRWGQHRKHLRRGRHHSVALQRAWDKYGEIAFQFRALLICTPKDLHDYEQRCLDGLKPEYNICKIVGTSLGVKRSPEARARMSLAASRRVRVPHSAATREKLRLAHTGKVLTAEHRAKLSAAHTGKALSAKTRALLRIARIGNKNSLGCHPSAETRAKLSAAQKINWQRRKQAAL